MALPFRRTGTGFLNGVAGVITGYNFDSKVWNEGEDKEYTSLTVELLILQDGADEPVQQFLRAGFLYPEHSISKDGQTLESDDDRPIIAEDSEFAKLLQSAVEAGLNPTPFEESNLRNLAGLVNQRFLFKREIDTELTEKMKKAGKSGKRKGKDGKEYPYDLLLVAEYLGEVEKKGRSASAKSNASKKGVNGAAKNADADALVEQADSVLMSILADAKDNRVDRSGLSAKIVRYSTEHRFSEDSKEHNEIRESLRKLIGSEDFLNRNNGWEYDSSAKGQPVALA